MTVAESKQFKCTSDLTLYTLEPADKEGNHLITWNMEDGTPDNDIWSSTLVDRNFQLGNWYFIEEQKESNIARPILTERKVGKVQMDLFDSGFPNAITEVAKVMTWAAENKGYKPHDWKGLPNAETEFSAAASRHRVKGFIQKAEGIAAIDRTDEESNIVHLAHAAFNILAELELVLTGKIK